MKIANTEYNTIGAYKLLMSTLKEKPLNKTLEQGASSASYVFFNKNKEIALLSVHEQNVRRGYCATISVCTVRKSATEGYFIKELGKLNLRSSETQANVLNILNLELDYLYRGNHYASRMVAVAQEIAAKQGYKILLAHAPKDPIISFKNINNKITENESTKDRTELFFKSCGFKDVGTYKSNTHPYIVRTYARQATRPLAPKIEVESRFISDRIAKKMQNYGDTLENVAK